MSNVPQPVQAASVLLEARHEGIATLVMNRPDRLNALDTKLVTTLNDTLGRIARDGSVRVVVLTGAGRAFCAGGDLALIGQDRSIAATRDLELLLASGTQAVLTMRSTTGCGIERMVSTACVPEARSNSRSRVAAIERSCPIKARSPPAQNARPAPVSTTTRTDPSLAMRPRVSLSVVTSLVSRAFSRSGRFITRVAMPSCLASRSTEAACTGCGTLLIECPV